MTYIPTPFISQDKQKKSDFFWKFIGNSKLELHRLSNKSTWPKKIGFYSVYVGIWYSCWILDFPLAAMYWHKYFYKELGA